MGDNLNVQIFWSLNPRVVIQLDWAPPWLVLILIYGQNWEPLYKAIVDYAEMSQRSFECTISSMIN